MTLRPNQNIINKIYKMYFLHGISKSIFQKEQVIGAGQRIGWSRSEDRLEQLRDLIGAGRRTGQSRSEDICRSRSED